ncbi:MAG: cobalt chelatase [Pseudorhodoferax sp.]
MTPRHWPAPPRADAAGLPPTPPQLARWHEQVEELCVGAIRALSGEADLHYRGRRLHRGRQPLPLFGPHLAPALERGDDAGSFRGAADGIALRLAHSDVALHRRLCPQPPVERLLFELLEQLRCEALADPAMPGVARNLRHRFDAWSRAYHHARLNETTRGMLLYTVAQIGRSRVTGEPVLEDTEDLIEGTRADLVPRLGTDLAGLRRHRRDQAAYAVHALAIARAVAALLAQGAAAAKEDAAGEGEEDDGSSAFRVLMDFDPPAAEAGRLAQAGEARVVEGEAQGYRVFTRAHDREVAATTLVRPEPLRELRERLDARIAAQGVQLPWLVRALQALLARPREDGWHDGQEEGLLDGRRLARLVALPTERRLFRAARSQPLADCAVTLLLDCSASMKEHAEWTAMLADVLARALERIGARCEVLGFTTGAWNGGRAQRDWQRAGRPARPGRLNELCHIVFKDAATPWRRARPGLAALLKPDLFREGVDGEALQWAAGRLAAQEAGRRILLVFSDGCPMDGATRLANDAHYLDRHLQQVAQRIEQQGRIALYGVGVGLDLSPYYAASHVLDLAHAGAGNAVFREVVGVLGGRVRR